MRVYRKAQNLPLLLHIGGEMMLLIRHHCANSKKHNMEGRRQGYRRQILRIVLGQFFFWRSQGKRVFFLTDKIAQTLFNFPSIRHHCVSVGD